LWHYSFIGLRQSLVHYFYPCNAAGWQLVLAFYDALSLGRTQLCVVDDTGEPLLKFDMAFEQRATTQEAPSGREQRTWRIAADAPGWLVVTQPLDPLVIPRPGLLSVMFRSGPDEAEVSIGTITCAQAEPIPLTADRIAAIRADPEAAKQVRLVAGCKQCPAKLFVVAGLERPSALLPSNAVWYQEAPEKWTCECGSSAVDLQSIRRNLHALLGTHIPADQAESAISFIRMYERSSLADLCADLGALLDDSPAEEEVQQFLAEHTVFFHRFSPVRIKPKAPILTKNRTDFAILDSRGMLLLVELERPSIRLLKKDGDITQQLQHAFDQVKRWMHTMQRRWTAALDCMGFSEAEVAGVRGVVIAGRDGGYSSEHLMRLKGDDRGPVEFYTYDDLLEDAVSLARDLS
jgi:hypothetical protein